MKTVWINLLSIIRKFKFAAFLNILGFSAAFAAFMIIMMQLHHEYTFENYHPNASRIYQIKNAYTDYSYSMHNRPFIDEVIQSSPYIESGSILSPYFSEFYFTIEGDSDISAFKEPIFPVYPEVTQIFHFDLTEGDAACLNTPGKVLIPLSLAKKLFGNELATGKMLRPLHEEVMQDRDYKHLEIGGVYKDFPANTQLGNGIYINMEKQDQDNRINYNYVAYVLLNENVNPDDIVRNFNDNSDYANTHEDKNYSLQLVPIEELYFRKDTNSDYLKTGNRETSNILLLIALLVILVATINYTNFSTSIAPMRIKSINTQKVLGASDFLLKRTLLLETLSVCLISFLLSLLIVQVFNRTGYISFIDTDLNFSSHWVVVMMTAAIAVIIGCIAGIYPAYFMMKYPPAVVLKGTFGLSPAGRRLRTGLVGSQFVISFALIIAAFFIYTQNKYIQDFNVGFQTDQIAIVNAAGMVKHKDVYISKLKENPDIEDVAFSQFRVGGTNNYMNWGGMKYQEQEMFQSHILPVSWNFIDVMGIQYEGQKLTPSFENAGVQYMVPNQKLKEEYGMETLSKLRVSWQPETDYTIPGFIGNINPKSLKYGVENFTFLIGGEYYTTTSYIKI